MIASVGTLKIEEIVEPAELAGSAAREAAFGRNLRWFEAHAKESEFAAPENAFALSVRSFSLPTRPSKLWHSPEQLILRTKASSCTTSTKKRRLGFMLLRGSWLQCDDGEARPILRGAIQTGAGGWVEAPFLVDTGADQTVFSAAILSALGLPTEPTPYQLLGVGGTSPSVLVRAAIHFTNEAGTKILFRGQFAAFTALESLDMCLLGRDITRLFAVIVDRPQNVVCLARQPHQYVIGNS